MKNFTKFSLLLLAFSVMSMNAWAQQRGTVNGTLVDDQTGEPVTGVVVGYFLAGSDDPANYVAESNSQGKFTISQIPYGDYSFVFSFISYIEDTIAVKIDKATVDLGEVRMKSDAKHISTVTIAGTAPRASVQGDTLAFNADAFKVTQDATAGDLISKMQGVTVENNQVTFMGQSVNRILLDGKEFFGDDVASAINNLPAEMISEVEAFTRMSDQSQFTGIDDGNSYMAMNFRTRNGMNKATVGQVKATYGFDDKYLVSGNVTSIKDDRKFTVTALSNNLNIMDASQDELSGGGRTFFMPGVNKVHNAGINYINKWNAWDVNGNYRFSYMDTHTTQDRERYDFPQGGDVDFTKSSSTNGRENYNHSFGGRIEWKNENNRLMIRPSATINTSDNNSFSESMLQRMLANSNSYDDIYKLNSNSNSDNTGYNFGLGVDYTRLLGKPGRTLSLNVRGNLSKSDGNSTSYSEQHWYDPIRDSIIDQRIDNYSKSYSLSARLQYAEPIATNLRLTATYDFSYRYSDSDKRADQFNFDPAVNAYEFSPELSNVYNNGYMTHQVGPGISYSGARTNITAGINYEYAHRNADQELPVPQTPLESVSFNNFVYNMVLRHKFQNSANLRLDVRSRTSNPSITQLQDVLDVSNPQYIYQGNPDLKSEYTNSMNASFNTANPKNAHTFSVGVNGSITSNSITNSTLRGTREGIDITDNEGNVLTTISDGVQYSKPVNLNGAWNAGTYATYGMPVKFIGSNMNFNASFRYNETPGMSDGTKYTTKRPSVGAGVGINSNISSNLDFSVRYNLSYSVSKYDGLNRENNKDLTQFISSNVTWITWMGITFKASAFYNVNRVITQDHKNESVLVNASLGKKILKGLGEINVGVNDLLDEGKAYSYNAQSNYTQSTWSNTLGRYVSINFIYNIRKYDGYTPSNLSRGESPQRMERGGRPQGMPGGGMMPPSGGGGFGGGRGF